MKAHKGTSRTQQEKFINWILSLSPSLKAIAVDRNTGIGRAYYISKGERDTILRSLRYWNAKGRDIYALLGDGFIVLDDVPYTRMSKIRHQGLFTILETHSGSYHLVAYVGKTDPPMYRELLSELQKDFASDPSNSGRSTRIPGFKNHKYGCWVNLLEVQTHTYALPVDILVETFIRLY